MSGKDPDKGDLNKLVSNAVGSIALLGLVTNDLNNFRCEQIRPALKPEFAALCLAEIPRGKWLFGEDLPKRIRDIKETAKSLQDHPENETSTTIDKPPLESIFPGIPPQGRIIYGKASKGHQPKRNNPSHKRGNFKGTGKNKNISK